jgi:hypothetical protein
MSEGGVFVPAELAARADARVPQPDYRFSSDGCSGGLSWLWRSITGRGPPFEGCCVAHDFAYWQGGTRAEHRAADRALRRCVIAKAREQYGLVGRYLVIALAWLMWAVVRVFGGPCLPHPRRWSYGWRWPRGYT